MSHHPVQHLGASTRRLIGFYKITTIYLIVVLTVIAVLLYLDLEGHHNDLPCTALLLVRSLS